MDGLQAHVGVEAHEEHLELQVQTLRRRRPRQHLAEEEDLAVGEEVEAGEILPGAVDEGHPVGLRLLEDVAELVEGGHEVGAPALQLRASPVQLHRHPLPAPRVQEEAGVQAGEEEVPRVPVPEEELAEPHHRVECLQSDW